MVNKKHVFTVTRMIDIEKVSETSSKDFKICWLNLAGFDNSSSLVMQATFQLNASLLYKKNQHK